jgi:hypothetical protein
MWRILEGAGLTLAPMAFVSVLAAATAMTHGCVGPGDRYTIVMSAHGDSLDRSIRIERTQSHDDSLQGVLRPALEDGLHERLASAYLVTVDTARTAPYVATRRFADVPDDIGTRGHYRHCATPLGESFFYAERIRGMDDPNAWVERRFASADTLASAVTEWLQFELVTQPEWPRVAGRLEPELRTIARKYAALTLVGGSEDSLEDGWLTSYATEHPLFMLLCVPFLGEESETDLAPYLAHARADLAQRMGLRSPADESRVLAFLADGPTALASYERWLQRSSGLREDDLERLLMAMTYDPGPRGDDAAISVKVVLRLPNEPISTNGKWNDSTGCVRWSGECASLDGRADALPLACAAIWSVPDTVVQKRLFGDVLLEKAELYFYADWFAALSPARQAEWNQMLLSLRPGRTARLEHFRFKDEKGAADASALARTTLLDAVRANAEERAGAAAKARAAPPKQP